MMTLPNRTGYNVERKAETGDSVNGGPGGTVSSSGAGASGHGKNSTASSVLSGVPSGSGAFGMQHSVVGVIPVDPLPQLSYVPSSSFPLISSSSEKQDLLKLGKPPIFETVINEIPSHTLPDAASSSRMYDSYKALSLEGLSPDEIQEKKNFVQKHRLQPHMLQIIEYCKKEGIIPNLPANLYQPNTLTDYSLSEFLEAQGIECPEDDPDPKGDEFTFKLQQLKTAYNEELDKLNRVCNEFVQRMTTLLREQGQIRTVTDQEIQAKTLIIQQKFDFVRNQLRTNVCNAILVLQKQYNHQSKRKRRSLSKRATEVLSHWFFEHINDPYPSDEEKSMLAAQCVLSLNQVNNWFGNKRIRYKRKCLEEEARRNKAQSQVAGIPPSPGMLSNSPADFNNSPPPSPPYSPTSSISNKKMDLK